MARNSSVSSMRTKAINGQRPDPGDTGEVVDGTERAISLALPHDSAGQRRTDSGKSLELDRIGTIDVHRLGSCPSRSHRGRERTRVPSGGHIGSRRGARPGGVGAGRPAGTTIHTQMGQELRQRRWSDPRYADQLPWRGKGRLLSRTDDRRCRRGPDPGESIELDRIRVIRVQLLRGSQRLTATRRLCRERIDGIEGRGRVALEPGCGRASGARIPGHPESGCYQQHREHPNPGTAFLFGHARGSRGRMGAGILRCAGLSILWEAAEDHSVPGTCRTIREALAPSAP